MPESTKPKPVVFGTVWTFQGSDPYIALCPADGSPDQHAWMFIGPYEGAEPFVLYGFCGGDPDQRLAGYEQLEVLHD